MSNLPIALAFFLVISAMPLSGPLLGNTWEFGMKVTSGGVPVARTVYLYHGPGDEYGADVTAPVRQGVTSTDQINFRCDIGDNNTTSPTIPPIVIGSYYVRIGTRYARLETGYAIPGTDADFTLLFDGTTFSLAPNAHRTGLSIGTTSNWPYSGVNLFIDQTLADNQTTVGTVQRWRSSASAFEEILPIHMTYEWQTNVTQVVKADQGLYLDQSSVNEKYNNWSTLPDVVNHHQFDINASTPPLISYFKQAKCPVTITSALMELPGTTGDSIDFKDPWFIDYLDSQHANQLQNEGMNAPYRRRGVPFTPDFTTPYEQSQKYNGVFLGHNSTFDPSFPIYSVNAPTRTIGGITFYFQSWSTVGARVENNLASSTAVVFDNLNATVTAQYKAHLRSNDTQGLASGGQRKLIRDGSGILHMAYSSANAVWYCRSTDNGSTWTQEIRLNPIGSQAKSPALASVSTGSGYNVYITYEIDLAELLGFAAGPAVVLAKCSGGAYVTSRYIEAFPSLAHDATPAIAMYGTRGYVVFKPSASSSFRKVRFVLSSGEITQQVNSLESTSDGGCLNPAIATSPVEGGPFWIAYQKGSDIYTADLVNGTTLENVSSGSGCTGNSLPSLAYYHWRPYGTDQYAPIVSWIGNNGSFTVSVTRRRPNGLWSSFTQTGAYVQGSPEVSATTSVTNQAIVGWWNSYGNRNEYARIVGTVFQPTQYIYTSAGYFHITDGPDFTNMKAVSFYGAGTALYPITPINRDFSTLSKLGAEDSARYGRQLVVSYQGGEIVYGLKSIRLDGENVRFAAIADTLAPATVEEIAPLLITKPFQLAPTSDFRFTSTLRELYPTKLTGLTPLHLEADLIDVQTGSVVGVFASHVTDRVVSQDLGDVVFAIDCNQIRAGSYSLRVRLQRTTEEAASYTIVDQQYEATPASLAKNGEINVTFRGELPMPTTYGLDNYPNPFNPSTTVRVSLPTDGYARLVIYDALAREVTRLCEAPLSSGYHAYTWNAGTVASGVYFARVQVTDRLGKLAFQKTSKLLLIK
jgi:hypothetical protein